MMAGADSVLIPRSDARWALFAGWLNECFLPASQVATWDFLDRQRKDTHALHVLPSYSHLDMFFGEHAARDVFPLIHAELARPTPSGIAYSMSRPAPAAAAPTASA